MITLLIVRLFPAYSRPERRRIRMHLHMHMHVHIPGGSSLRRSWRRGASRPGRGRAAERWRGMNERGRCSTSVTCLCYVPQKHQLASQCTVTFLPLNNGSPATRQCSAPAFLRPRNSLAFQLTGQCTPLGGHRRFPHGNNTSNGGLLTASRSRIRVNA